MAKYLVKSNLKFDGKDYRPGETVDLPEKEVPALLAAGAVEPAGKATPDQPAEGTGRKGKKE